MTLYRLGAHTPVLPDDRNFWIAPDARVIGNVVVQSLVSIWFGACLRGDNETITVGEGSNIQDNCVLHTDPGYGLQIGRNCTLGHGAIVHGCRIGDQSLIGMGAIVMNGAVIGRNCLIGAGAVITENSTIPDGSLVLGAPGKVRRKLDESEREGLLDSARSYQRKIEIYRDGLSGIPT